MNVTGSVEVANAPTVHAQQAGPWRVEVAGSPGVRIQTPSFLGVDRTYTFTWPTGMTTTYRLAEVRNDGWVRVAAQGGTARNQKWVNTMAALEIVDVTP